MKTESTNTRSQILDIAQDLIQKTGVNEATDGINQKLKAKSRLKNNEVS